MTKEKKEWKAFNIRMPIETWAFIKKQSVDQESSMMSIIVNCVEKYRKRIEKIS